MTRRCSFWTKHHWICIFFHTIDLFLVISDLQLENIWVQVSDRNFLQWILDLNRSQPLPQDQWFGFSCFVHIWVCKRDGTHMKIIIKSKFQACLYVTLCVWRENYFHFLFFFLSFFLFCDDCDLQHGSSQSVLLCCCIGYWQWWLNGIE